MKKNLSAKNGQKICYDRYTSLWMHGVLFFALIAGSFYATGKLQKAQAEFQSAENSVFESQKNYIAQQYAQKDLESFEGNDDIARILPPEEELVEFIEFFEQTATENSVAHTLSLRTQESSSRNGVNEIPMTIEITGSLGYIVQFLVDIESKDFYIQASSVTISNVSGTQDTQRLIMEATTYWRLQ